MTSTEICDNEPVEWIDRTNEPLGEMGNGYALTETLQSLFLTNNRLTAIKNLEPCVALRELILQRNSVRIVEGLDTLQELVQLDLYMNQVEHLSSSCFENNPKLQKLDLSFNQLRSLDGFPCENLSVLEELFLIGNKIKQIPPFRSMPKLTMLELGDNRLRVVENLDMVPSLRELWLGRNKLTQIQNLDALVNLRQLGMQSNRIEQIEGLDHLVHLEELYLSHNGITSMDGIQNLRSLKVLDLGSNLIDHVEHVDSLPSLEELWIGGNRLHSFDELAILSTSTKLETVYLEGNPLASDPEYLRKALAILPDTLDQLDALKVEEIQQSLKNSVQVEDISTGDPSMPALTNETVSPDTSVTVTVCTEHVEIQPAIVTENNHQNVTENVVVSEVKDLSMDDVEEQVDIAGGCRNPELLTQGAPPEDVPSGSACCRVKL